MNRRKLISLLSISVMAAMMLLSCGGKAQRHEEGNIEIQRFDRVLFETPVSELRGAVQTFAASFRSPLLTLYPDDPQFMLQLQDFMSDSTVRDIFRITSRRYPTLFWLEAQLTDALAEAQRLDDEIRIDQVATYVSCLFDYAQRVAVDRESGSVLVSLDQYALGNMESYSYFGLPMFLVERCDSAYLAVDILAEVARQYLAIADESSLTMLDLMISEGKVLYFLDQVMEVDDAVKIRYSADQLDWARKNEAKIWAYFIQNNLLYEKDFARYHNFVDEAPKTNAFKDSAPRTTEFVGWQIVRNYMKNNRCTLKELFANSDAQSILQASGYRPQQ